MEKGYNKSNFAKTSYKYSLNLMEAIYLIKLAQYWREVNKIQIRV